MIYTIYGPAELLPHFKGKTDDERLIFLSRRFNPGLPPAGVTKVITTADILDAPLQPDARQAIIDAESAELARSLDVVRKIAGK